MSILLDTNILLRMAQDNHPINPEAMRAAATLLRQGEILHIVPQTLYEFWSVATRAIDFNGLGLSVPDAAKELARLKTIFSFLPDNDLIYSTWEQLVIAHKIK